MRILFFTHPGTNSRDILLDMAAGFEQAGHDVLRWELEPWLGLYKSGGDQHRAVIQQATSLLARFVQVNRIELSIGMWANALSSLAATFRDGQPTSFFEVIRHRHLMFWLDAPHWASGGGMQELFGSPLLQTDYIRHYVNNPGIAREMTDLLGFGQTIGRGYGVNERVFRPYPDETKRFDVVFGAGPGDPKPTEMMLRELESDDPDVDAIRSERGQRVLAKLDAIAESFDPTEREAVAELLRALLNRRLATTGVPMLDDMEALERFGHGAGGAALRAKPRFLIAAFTHLRSIDAWRRSFTISYLSKHLNCAVFGSFNVDDWPCRATMLGELKYADMARAYSSAHIGLNAMRWQDDIGLNLKPYEIAASGACLLCDARVGFADAFLDGIEAEGFATPGEALRKSRALLENPGRMRSMAEAGRMRTLSDHTWAAVSRELVSFATETSTPARAAA